MVRLLQVWLLALPLAAADIAVAPQSLSFYYQFNTTILPPPGRIVVASPQSPVLTVTRPSDAIWLQLPTSATVPAPGILNISVDPGKLSLGTYMSAITLRFAQGSISIPVTLVVAPGPVLLTDPAVMLFDSGSAVQNLFVGLSSQDLFLPTVTTTTPWLAVQRTITTPLVVASSPGPALNVGEVRVQSSSVIGVRNNPVSVPVVYLGSGLASLGPLAMNPSAMSFTGSGQQQATVTGGAFTPSSDAKWLSASASGQTLTVSANAAGMEPGTYAGTVTLSSAGVLQFLPVTLTIGTPALAKVVNAASYAEGAVSPGEVVALGGSNLGPAALTGLSLDADGRVTSTLAGVQVLFNGIAAPLVYVSAMQLAAVAPYELDGQATATVQVKVNGQPSNSLTVPVAAVVPGVFTADASGAGQGAILNSDLAPNGPARPAAKGETVAIYMTGEGQTSPAGIDGKVTGAPPAPRLPVTATIDGLPAKVTFAGEAPGIVSGVMQVNVMVPETSRSGQLSLIIKVGDGGSQMGVTVSVR